MSKNKLRKFAEMMQFENLYQNFDYESPQLIGKNNVPVSRKGTWGRDHFGNDNPIILELACGRGEYTVALAERYPHFNFIGVDIKGARIYQGATYALEQMLKNVAFLRTRIELLDLFIGEKEINEIWITFPDPFLRKSKARRRLTSSFFLEKYRPLLKDGGTIHLKTDSDPLYHFTLDTAASLDWVSVPIHHPDIYSAEELPHPDLDIKTYYEEMHLADQRTITYTQLKILPKTN